MAIRDELSDEEQAIMVFLKRYFEQAGMPNALWILNESERIVDVRAVLNCYREFYHRHGTHWAIVWPAILPEHVRAATAWHR